MHIEYGRESHEQRGTEGRRRGAGTGTPGGRGAAEELAGTGDPALAQGVELVRVRAHGAGVGVRVRGHEPWDAIPDAAADGEGGHCRVYVGDLQGRTGATDVLDH